MHDGKSTKIWILPGLDSLADQIDVNTQSYSTLICDEMKVKGSLVFNASDDSLVGFVENLLGVRHVLNNMLASNNEDLPEHQLATYINQWIYQDLDGKVPFEFYYNMGKLNAETVYNQCLRQITYCKMALN